MVRTIVGTWQTATGRSDQSLAAILASAPDAADELRHLLATQTPAAFTSDDMIERLDHFATESRLIRAVPDTINAATIGAFGELAYESHRAADRHLKNQTAATNRLVKIAQQLGAPAASAFGAGFGGSVWAFVDQSQATAFLDAWRSRYQNEFPGMTPLSEFFSTRPGMSAIAID
jgi:galactokinase